MDYSNFYIIIGYTLVMIVATFLLREKYPERYSIGCILCFLAPAWGQFYKNKKSSIYIWLFLMAIERGVNKSISNDSQDLLIAWGVIGGISSIIMYFRIMVDKTVTVVQVLPEDHIDKYTSLQDTGGVKNQANQAETSENPERQSTNHFGMSQQIRYETGLSRIGIIAGIVMAVVLAICIFSNISSYYFSQNSLLFSSFIVSLSATVGFLTWGLIVIIYRAIVWVKCGFTNSVSYTVKDVFKVQNKTWATVSIVMILLTGIQIGILSDNNMLFKKKEEAPAPALEQISPCDFLRSGAEKLKIELEKQKQIYGRYPKELDGIQLLFTPSDSIHIQKLTSNYYKIAISENSCDTIYTIESNKNDIKIQTVK